MSKKISLVSILSFFMSFFIVSNVYCQEKTYKENLNNTKKEIIENILLG